MFIYLFLAHQSEGQRAAFSFLESAPVRATVAFNSQARCQFQECGAGGGEHRDTISSFLLIQGVDPQTQIVLRWGRTGPDREVVPWVCSGQGSSPGRNLLKGEGGRARGFQAPRMAGGKALDKTLGGATHCWSRKWKSHRSGLIGHVEECGLYAKGLHVWNVSLPWSAAQLGGGVRREGGCG